MGAPVGIRSKRSGDYSVTLLLFAGFVAVVNAAATIVELLGLNTNCTNHFSCISSMCGPCRHVSYAAAGSILGVVSICVATVVVLVRRQLAARRLAAASALLLVVAVAIHLAAFRTMNRY